MNLLTRFCGLNHPDCALIPNELLSEKQYVENTERYKGFDTKIWQYNVTAVLENDCDLQVGDRLSQAEYGKKQEEYGFQRFAELHYRVTEVQHPKISVVPGDLLTADEVEALKGGDSGWV